MKAISLSLALFTAARLSLIAPGGSALACCAVVETGAPVVNADQSVIIFWDKDTQTEHFIRKAGFASNTKDVGFLVPTPSRPALEESGNDAFTSLAAITAPRVRQTRGFGC